MSSAEDRYRDADDLARSAQERLDLRRADREREQARLRRMHAQEDAEDRRITETARAMLAVRRWQWQQEPEQLRRSMARFEVGFALIPLIGAVMVWMTVAGLLIRQGASPWAGHGLGAVYFCGFGAALWWYARSCWFQERPGRGPATAVWGFVLAPVAVLVGSALAAWVGWSYVAVVLLVFLLVTSGGIVMCREIPRAVRSIEAKKET